jgi:hypothetical protein
VVPAVAPYESDDDLGDLHPGRQAWARIHIRASSLSRLSTAAAALPKAAHGSTRFRRSA